jgi:hypothetical protein
VSTCAELDDMSVRVNGRKQPNGSAWTEVVLAMAVVAVVLQLWPSLGKSVIAIADVRSWSRIAWFSANAVIVLTLIGVRFSPGLYARWQERRENVARTAAVAANRREPQQKKEALKRIADGRKNRMY